LSSRYCRLTAGKTGRRGDDDDNNNNKAAVRVVGRSAGWMLEAGKLAGRGWPSSAAV
jgi:hypothetical protein